MERYKEIYQMIPKDKKKIGKKIIDELMFIDETLDVLKEDVRTNGPTEHYVNGKQDFIRERTAMKEYNYMIQRFGQLIKQLISLIPEKTPEEGDELKAFLNEG